MRILLSDAHARALAAKSRLLDTPVQDPLMEERLLRIRTQIVCALVLRTILGEMGYDLPEELDLLPLLDIARRADVLSRREGTIFAVLNAQANQAKHWLDFRSRL